jgi:hypothetical protein
MITTPSDTSREIAEQILSEIGENYRLEIKYLMLSCMADGINNAIQASAEIKQGTNTTGEKV